jgi:hypothetical protein
VPFSLHIWIALVVAFVYDPRFFFYGFASCRLVTGLELPWKMAMHTRMGLGLRVLEQTGLGAGAGAIYASL